MTIDMIHRCKVRIDLSGDELLSFHVTYGQLSADDLQTRIMIGELLSAARDRVGFDHENKKLFIETFPHDDGGCVLYVTALTGDRRKAAKKETSSFPPVILTVKDTQQLCRMCACLQQRLRGKLLHSSLFFCRDQYSLALVCAAVDGNMWQFLSEEWNCRLAEGSGELLRIQEHEDLLIPSGAVEILAKC